MFYWVSRVPRKGMAAAGRHVVTVRRSSHRWLTSAFARASRRCPLRSAGVPAKLARPSITIQPWTATQATYSPLRHAVART
jgi:hypothetical protein